MAITLGTLFVELKANTAQFLDGLTKAQTASKAFGRDTQSSLRGIGEMFAPLGEMGEKLAGVFGVLGSSVRSAFADIGKEGYLVGGLTALTGGTVALGGALFALAEHAAESGAAIFEASEKTGLTAEQLSSLRAVCKQTGGDFDSLTNALARAGVNLQKAITSPASEAAKVLSQALGGSAVLAAEKTKLVGDRLQDTLKHIFAMSSETSRNTALAVLFGKTWMDNIEVLKILATQGYGPGADAAKRFGTFVGDDEAKQAALFKVSIHDLTAELSGLGVAIGKDVIPVFTQLMVAMHGMKPNVKALGDEILSTLAKAGGPLTSLLFSSKFSKAAGDESAKATQELQDYWTMLNKLLAQAKASGDGKNDPPTKIKAHSDALANLIAREQEQLAMLNTNGNQVQQLRIEYNYAVDGIHKMVAGGLSFKEGLIAQGLELDIYHKKLMDLAAVFPKVGESGWAQLIKQPAFAVPTTLPFTLTPPQVPGFKASTPAGMAEANRNMDKTRAAEEALRREADLSRLSLERLADAFPGLTNAEIAAQASGQRMIEQLSKMVGFSDQFKITLNSLVDEGANFGANLVKIVGGAVDKIEDKFAEMAVKGRVNFRELGQSIEQQMVKATIQKGVSVGLSGIEKLFGGKGAASKADGSSGSAFYVIVANKAGNLIGGASGEGIAKPVGTLMKDAGIGGTQGAGASPGPPGASNSALSEIAPALSGVTRIMSGMFKGLGGIFGSIFGGFLASGGPVLPGKAYTVGEHGKELFFPQSPGYVAPSLAQGMFRQQHTTVHVHVNGVQDMDSFRRSQSQIASEMYRVMALAEARRQ